MISPSSEQAESIAHLFHSNNHHVQNFKDWLDANLQSSFQLIINPSTSTENILRLTGEAGALQFLKQVVNKKPKA